MTSAGGVTGAELLGPARAAIPPAELERVRQRLSEGVADAASGQADDRRIEVAAGDARTRLA